MKKTFIVGIAGGSASGKSTFSGQLESSLAGLRIQTIHMDSYFKPPEKRPRSEAPVTGITYMDDNHPQTMDLAKLASDLKKLAAGKTCDVIIVEGLLTLWDKDICSQLDLKLFADCKPDERIVRRLRRNMQHGLTFDEISSVYLDLVRYRHDEYVESSKWRADFILNGSNPSEKTMCMLTEYIKNKCGESD